jgi:hypothetical protein
VTGQQPPSVATWLAQRLVSGPRCESLLGDLIEQYRQGRSWSWYWRQVLAAILVVTVHDLAAHKTLALRTLTIGWTLYYLFSFPATWAGGIAEDWLSQHVILCAPASFWCEFWQNQLSVELLIYVAAAGSGGIVARLHHKHWVAMLSLYAASLLLFECGMISWMAYQSSAPVPISRFALIVANLTVVVRPVSVFIGGILGGSIRLRPRARSVDSVIGSHANEPTIVAHLSEVNRARRLARESVSGSPRGEGP